MFNLLGHLVRSLCKYQVNVTLWQKERDPIQHEKKYMTLRPAIAVADPVHNEAEGRALAVAVARVLRRWGPPLGLGSAEDHCATQDNDDSEGLHFRLQ